MKTLKLLLSYVVLTSIISFNAMAAENAAPTPTSITAPTAHPASFADLADRLLPSVVNISTTQIIKKDDAGDLLQEMPQFPEGSPFEDFFKEFMDRHNQGAPGGQAAPRRATSLGSGFIVDASGIIVTNNHVIEDADEITVILHDNTNLKAELIGRDTKTDLALLKVKTDKKLTAVSFGDSDTMRVGDWILAIGNPFGLGGTVTSGIISARARDINAGPYDDFIQTDASINRGNSGGPMFNLNGEVIGINTAIFSPSGGSVGIGFAIPANMAKTVVAQLKDKGKITRGWIGVRIQQVTDDIAKSLGLPKTYGAMVSAITPKTPAAEAGLQTGDVIVGFNNQEITEMKRLPRIVAETPVGTKVPLAIWRKGKQVALTIKVAELPADLDTKDAEETAPDNKDGKVKSEKVEGLGISLAPLTPALRKKFELADDTKGVLVVDVADDGTAADKGIQPGDVVVEASNAAVTEPAQVVEAAKTAKKADKPLLLLIDRNGDARFVAMQVK